MVETLEWPTTKCKEVLCVHDVTVDFVHETWWPIQTPQRGFVS